MKINYIEIGKRIADERVRKGWTQEELAEKIKITPAFLSNIETGKRKMGLDTFLVIAKTLNVSIDYLTYNETNDTEIEKIIKRLSWKLVKLDNTKKKDIMDIMEVITDKLYS